MTIIKRAAAWLRINPFRNYLVTIALAILPVSVFIFASHKLLLNQLTANLIAQSSQSGKLIGFLLERHFEESRILLESFGTRPSLIQQMKAGRFQDVTNHLQQAKKLSTDFESFAVYELDGTLRAVYPAAPEVVNKNYKDQDWYTGVSKEWKPYSSAVFQSDTGSKPWVGAIAVPIKDRSGQ